ncbi:MAG: dehydrogenase E1 component subunit alpha/beta [Oligoflexia bacterium]|nr:dehydrogenase E1 component subunit alpha/beta [Oligoflexia bacterium]
MARLESSVSSRSSKKPHANGSANGGQNGSSHSKQSPLTKEQLISAYRQMLRARLVDAKTITLYKQNKCHFQIGVAGHEAVQVATGNVFRPGQDWFYPYYRDMALCAALGMTNEEFLLNAMNKKEDPNSHGRQMPMHYGHKALRIVNQSSPTGTQLLQAVGCAIGIKRKQLGEVVYVSLGEGTCSQGDFHEALNWAAREKLPVLFMVQNNKYAISVPIAEQLAGQSVYKIAAGYENLDRFEIDGTDYLESYTTVRKAYERALSGGGPSLIEAHVPRLQSHSISDNHLKYRSQADIDQEQKRCPIVRMERYLIDQKLVTAAELTQIQENTKALVDAASEWAEQQPDCDAADALSHVCIKPDPGAGITESVPTGEEVYLVDALNHALDEELERNPNMFVFGQDVAHGKGGVFTVTTGLTAKYGNERVFNAPLAESSICGVAVGMATMGFKPVAEVQFGDYVWTGMMQIRNELAMMLYRSGGDFSCPAVIRIPVGGYIHGGCYHSQNIEATFAHFPGLIVAYPSNATDAKGMLKSAIRGEDPVLFLEHKGLYRQVYAKGAEGGRDQLIPLGRAKVVRPGADATILTWGALVNKSLIAAKEFEERGKSVEVVDLRTIAPLDLETIFQSVRKTGRVLIAHEDVTFMGFGAEVSAQISELCFEYLDAPVMRVGMKPVAAVPHSPILEAVILPQNDDVLQALAKLLAF